MAVEEEVLVRRILVLANACFQQRRPAHPGKAVFHILTDLAQTFRGRHSLAQCRIESRTTHIGGHLETAPLVPRNAVKQLAAVIDPGWHLRFEIARIARGCAKEKHLLARGVNHVAQQGREHLAEPGAATKRVRVGRKLGAVGEFQGLHLAGRDGTGLDGELAVFAALLAESFQHVFAVAARGEEARVLLAQHQADVFQVDLRIQLGCVGGG